MSDKRAGGPEQCARSCCWGEHHFGDTMIGTAETEPEHEAAKAGVKTWSRCKHCPAWRERSEEPRANREVRALTASISRVAFPGYATRGDERTHLPHYAWESPRVDAHLPPIVVQSRPLNDGDIFGPRTFPQRELEFVRTMPGRPDVPMPRGIDMGDPIHGPWEAQPRHRHVHIDHVHEEHECEEHEQQSDGSVRVVRRRGVR